MRIIRGKAINNIHYLSYFYYYHLITNRWHGIIIRTLEVPKICCLSRLNIWRNLLDPARKRQAVMKMKVDINKVICSGFSGNIWYVCKNGHDDLPLVDPSMNLPPCQIHDLPFLNLVLICLEFIIRLI